MTRGEKGQGPTGALKRPKLQRHISAAQFRDAIAAHAAELDRWIELSVDAFPSDKLAKAERLERVRDRQTGFRFFVETYLPHYVKGDASLFHERVFERFPEIIFGEGGARDAFVAPRGSSKSTHLSLAGALYCIVLGLEHYMFEVSNVYTQAALLLQAIKGELTANPRLSYDFPEATGQGRVWREDTIVTRNNIKIDALGAGQKVRGRRHGPHRPGLIFMDDLENDENVRSPDQRGKLERWIDGALLKVGPPDGSLNAVYVGTILHFDAVLARKAKSPAWTVHWFPAIIEWPERMDLWDQFEEVYHNEGPDAAKAFYGANHKAMDQGVIINWPAMQSLLLLMLIRAESHAAFACEYQNKPIAENNPFSSIIYWVKARPNLIHFGAIDPSLGKRGHGRDPSAILVGGIDPITGEMDLLEASIRKRLPDIIIADTIAFQKQYGCHLWFVEAVQFQEFFRTSLMRDAVKAGVALPALPITPHADKGLRIERLQPPIAAGLIRLNPSQTTLIDQLQQWPNADHDDGPDCLDMLWQNAVIYAKGASSHSGGISTSGQSASGGAMEGYRL